jgi:hypothetical protein
MMNARDARVCALRLEAEAMACWMRAGPCASTRPTHAPVSTGKPCTRPVAHSVAAVAVGSALARGQPPISLSLGLGTRGRAEPWPIWSARPLSCGP